MLQFIAEFLLRLISVGIWTGAGIGVYIYINNRWLMMLRNRSLKRSLRQITSIGLFMVPVGMGVFAPAAWLVCPGALYVFFLVDDVRLAWLRRRMTGELPVEAPGPARPNQAALPPKRKLMQDTTSDLHLVRYDIPVPAQDLACEPALTVAHLTDFHVSERMPASYYTDALERALAEAPDLVLLTGDYISVEAELPLLGRALKPLENHPRVYAILGNHDYWIGAQKIVPILERTGIHLLSGNREAVHYSPYVRIIGSEEPWGPAARIYPDPQAALDLVLTHTPDNIYHFLDSKVPRAVFSGHLHAGQVCLPVPGGSPHAIFLPSRYGLRFDRLPNLNGHFVFSPNPKNDSRVHLFVSAGVGTGRPFVRYNCPPDFFLVRFQFVGKAQPCEDMGQISSGQMFIKAGSEPAGVER